MLIVIVLITLIESCAVWDPADVKDTPVNVEERAQKALEEGMITLRESGIDKVLQGSTTIAEVLRSTVEDF